ncbi:MAG: UDP-N-acetylmuramate--L-alanine ligase [Bacteroidetes bacterium]|nr:UDP-N-acetylmuramate--L-alanine ligase [Bacteroidota bacterium]
MFGQFRRIHFIGIGGIGMSGIAEILLNKGFTVSGSDASLSPITEKLQELGATIYKGHKTENVKGADAVVFTAALQADNPELVAAREQKIPIIRRAEMLAELMRLRFGIGIAGTHGKTTTTSMTGMVLTEGGLDPTIVVGGVVNNFGSNAKVGQGDYIVVEADEYDRSFLKLTATIAVITNIEAEHLDIYKTGLGEIQDAFVQFANTVPFYGLVVCCLDEPHVQSILPRIERRVMTYGFSRQADLMAYDVEIDGTKTTFKVEYKKKELGSVTLQLPGIHNVKNALAAIGVGLELEVPFKQITAGLEKLGGIGRRFQVRYDKDFLVVDDYAHHPSEIAATLRAARSGFKKRRLIAVFQPHLFTRTRDFYEDFGRIFLEADKVIVTDIYGSREEPIEGISADMIVEAAKKFGHRDIVQIPKKDLIEYTAKNAKKGDVLVFMGAGDISKLCSQWVENLKEHHAVS